MMNTSKIAFHLLFESIIIFSLQVLFYSLVSMSVVIQFSPDAQFWLLFVFALSKILEEAREPNNAFFFLRSSSSLVPGFIFLRPFFCGSPPVSRAAYAPAPLLPFLASSLYSQLPPSNSSDYFSIGGAALYEF